MKWLAIVGLVIAIVLVVLWRQLDDRVEIEPAAADPAEHSPQPTARIPLHVKRPAAAEPAASEPAAPKKLDPDGDEFFYKFIEVVPRKVSREAAACYEGRQGTLHRNQKLVLDFKVRVRNGVVTMHDVRVKPDDPAEPDHKNNTLNDPALESCFIQKVARTTWRDDSLPDYEWPDELVIRPERGLKKYWRSNLEYVGQPAPK